METEKEKMLTGVLYAPFDDELKADRAKAKNVLHEYNKLAPNDDRRRAEYLKALFASKGEHCNVEQPFYCDYGYNISVGENFFSNMNCVILDEAKVTIGDNVLFAPNVSLYTATHPLDASLRSTGAEFAFPITIGDDVWLGGNVVVLPGVTIGDNSVIGAGSVVTKDIPSNVLAVGNPCKVVREIKEGDR